MASQPVFTNLDKIETTFDHFIPKPCYYCNDKGEYIIISSTDHDEEIVIFEFNLNTNKMNTLHCHNGANNGFGVARYYGHCIDPINYMFYAFGGNNIFVSFNLKTKQIEYDNEKPNGYNHLQSVMNFASCSYIPSLNQIHIADVRNYYVFNTNSNIVNSIDTNKIYNYPKVLFVPYTKQLMIFGCENWNNILYCDIDSISDKITDNYKFEWKLYSLMLPYKSNADGYDIILAFSTLVFVFYFKQREIYCLDIIHNRLYNYKSPHNIPESISSLYYDYNHYAVVSKDNYVHLFDFKQGFHYKACLHDLIPHDLYKIYSDYYEPLAIGYIKEQENNFIIPTIPFVLKQLIWRYYPLFV